MKKYLLLIGTIICMCLPGKSQTIIDLTTGTDLVGETDPIWEVQYPGAIGYWPLTISTGLVEFDGGAAFNSYYQDPCGKWVSPFVNPSTNNIVKGPGFTGIFTYKAKVYVDHCTVDSAFLDFFLMLADNSLEGVRINGTPYPHPLGVTHINPGSMNVPVAVTPGWNIVEVDVNNDHSFTGLQLCGKLKVYGGPPCHPIDLNCCDAPVGQVLSWSEVEDAVGYEIEFFWDDPDCCDSEGPWPIVSIVNSEDNLFLYYPGSGTSDCFSWRVRTVFADGTKSEYSEKECSCASPCETPTNLSCYIHNQINFNWNPVDGAAFYDFVITYNDPVCCSGGTPSTIAFSALSNVMTRPYTESCFSWKVRTHCENGGTSDWSEIQCGCPLTNAQTPAPEETSSRSIVNYDDISTSVVPNPANNFVTITIADKNNTSEVNNVALLIFNISGKEVFNSSISLNESKQIDVSHFNSGIYIFKILNNGKLVASDKLVIQ